MAYETLTRSVAVLDAQLDGTTLEAIFVPWDRPARVYGEGDPYDEAFVRGAFDVQIDRPSFSPPTIPLLPRHGSSETFGHTRKLSNADNGLHGVVAIRPSLRDDVAQMIDDGIDSVSIEFHPLQRNPRDRGDGVKWRDAAVLLAVALTSAPAYLDSKVLALRAADELAALERAARFDELQREIDELRAGSERYR